MRKHKCVSKGFGEILTLYGNTDRHTLVKAYKCDVCGKSFSMESMLTRHKQRHDAKKLKCDECGKIFNKLYSLQRHLRTHTGDKPSYSNQCDAAISSGVDSCLSSPPVH
jgi:KRAB domain-containing zinc finger protein